MEVFQGSILRLLLFVISISNLTSGISSNNKLFADDMFIFSFVYYTQTSANYVTEDLETVSKLENQWKMNLILI